jgi:hypothetical protein
VLAGPASSDPDSGLARGGAVLIERGSAFIATTQFFGNVAQSRAAGSVHNALGGAVYVGADAIVQLARSILQGNQASALGGNSAFGGGVANFSSAFADIGGSNYTGNQALTQTGAAFGGGLYLANDSILSQSRITRNAALSLLRGGQGFGGGIAFANNPKFRALQIVVNNNRAATAGSNLFGDHQSF